MHERERERESQERERARERASKRERACMGVLRIEIEGGAGGREGGREQKWERERCTDGKATSWHRHLLLHTERSERIEGGIEGGRGGGERDRAQARTHTHTHTGVSMGVYQKIGMCVSGGKRHGVI